MDSAWIDDLDGQAAADALVANHARFLEAEANEFLLAAHWADLHNEDSLPGRSGAGKVLPGTERAVRFGADGTPLVAEFAAAELGPLIGRGFVSAWNQIRNALDVRHRHPRLWQGIENLQVRPYQAVEVARRTSAAGLSLEQARWVDTQIDGYLAALPWSGFVDLVEAKIIAVDPTAAEERRRAEALKQFVATGQCNEYGLKTLICKARAGDVIFFVAMADRIAQILALRGDTDPVDVRRAKAVGILANPARAMELLEQYAATDAEPTPEPEPEPEQNGNADPEPSTDPASDETSGREKDSDTDEIVHEGDLHPSHNHADAQEAERHPCPTCDGDGTVTGDPTAFVQPTRIDPAKLRPNATLYVHTSLQSFLDRTGVARAEGVGAITVQQAIEFLGHTNVSVKPVIDLANQMPVDGYESPDWMREVVHLLRPRDVFPYSSNLSRNKDLDHPIPYRPMDNGGPPGQTDPYRMGPMTRYAHRVKTHARGWRHLNPLPGVYLWRTRHGYWFRVDRHGTHPLGRNPDLRAHGVHVEEQPAAPSPLEQQLTRLVAA